MKFDPTNGAKAYSYFGTIVKRWLILYNTKNYKKKINKVGVEVLTSENSTHVYTQGDEKVKSDLDKYVDIFVDHVSENIFELFPKKNDAQIADAILELFRKRETIEVFNKKALYILIREMTGSNTQHITRVINVMKKHHFKLQENYLTTGSVITTQTGSWFDRPVI